MPESVSSLLIPGILFFYDVCMCVHVTALRKYPEEIKLEKGSNLDVSYW